MQLLEGIEWTRIYYVKGELPRGSRQRTDVKDPPTSGWQNAIIMRGEKRSTIFCPYSFQSWNVRNDCAEIMSARDKFGDEEPDDDPKYHFDWLSKFIPRKWDEYQSIGYQRDYDTAALVLRKMGLPVPEQKIKGGEEDTRKKGGKPAGEKLIKIVNVKSKRGKFLKWFIDGGKSKSVREAMAEFSMTRSNALSYLHMINKDHGIGYDLVGDTATIVLPEGCDDPFEDDSWLD